ncbi:hypothetical protein EDB86DRAFT_3072260 [Lactarius hatsudake]|nr:hypothetical protein EDB86DRAFT_3072260 [Lactarius hatsudake]
MDCSRRHAHEQSLALRMDRHQGLACEKEGTRQHSASCSTRVFNFSAPEPATVPVPVPAPALAVQPIPPPPPLKPAPAPEPPRVVAPVSVPAAETANPDVPTRPTFKSPPAFTSIPPESDRESPAPTPVSAPAHAPGPTAAPVRVSPPKPGRCNSGSSCPGPIRISSPRSENAPLNSSRASLSRTTSTEASRAARQSRGWPPLRGGAVSSIVSGLNRNSVASDPRAPPPPSAGLQRGIRGRPPPAVERR